NQAVVAAEGGNDDGYSHDHGAGGAEDGVECGAGDTIVGSSLDLHEWKGEEISQIREAVESDDDDGAEGHGEGDVALGIFHFAGGEADVVPGVGGKQRANL